LTVFTSGLGSDANTTRAVSISQLAPVANGALQVLLVTAGLPGVRMSPLSESLIDAGFNAGGVVPVDVFVTMILQPSVIPTSIGLGPQAFVTETDG
jgi:hypothetical protein